MADRDQRTEEATPRKRERMREEGQIPRSADVTAAASVVAAVIGMAATVDSLVRQLTMCAVRSFRLVDVHRPLDALSASTSVLAPVAAPLFGAAAAAAAVGVLQARTFSLTLVLPKASRLDPLAQLQNLIPGKQQALEILKQLLKLGAVGYVAYALIAGAMPMFAVLAATTPSVAASFVGGVAAKLFVRVGIAFIVVAGFDYWLSLRKFSTDAMMSRDEVKDERKQEEGNPEVRGRIRRRMRELLKSRAITDVSKATVVVTNPTHFAVALRYVPDKDVAPIIVCKGKDELALEMRAIARKHQIPMVENRPLARALFADGKVGRAIPVDLYRGVAEVIAFVFQLNRRHGQGGGAALPERGQS
jgi:flagellar biosynthetic protein FlhB